MPTESPPPDTTQVSTPVSTEHSKPRVFSQSLRDSFRLFWPTLKKAAGLLIALHLVSAAAAEYFAFATETMLAEGREDLLFIAVTASLELLFTLVWSSVWTLALATSVESARVSTPRAPLIEKLLPLHFNQLIVEQIRVLAGIVMRLPLFLVPSFVFYVRTALVPYIVIFDSRYHLGQVDALKESRLLSRGRFALLFSLVLLSHLAPLCVEQTLHGPEGASLIENPFAVGLVTVMTFFINLWVGIFLFSVARRLIRMGSSWLGPSELSSPSLVAKDPSL